MSLVKSLALSLAATLPLTGVASAQSYPFPNWGFPSAPHLQDPRAQDFMRMMEMMRPYAQGEGPVVTLPPITGTVPSGNAPDLAQMMLRLRQAAPLPVVVDRDQDGVVSDEEAASHAEAVFVALDANGDRALSDEEVDRRSVMILFAQPTDPEKATENPRFTALDGNADGTVSKAEFLDVARAHYEAARDPVTDTVTPWSYRRTEWF